MLRLANGGLAKNIQEAYAKAIALDNELQAEINAGPQEAAANSEAKELWMLARCEVQGNGRRTACPLPPREEFIPNWRHNQLNHKGISPMASPNLG